MFSIIYICVVVSVTIVNLVSSLSENKINYFEISKNDKPCSFYDTVNITDGIPDNNNSISFGGILYSRDQYKIYDYVYRGFDFKREVVEHVRGCICQQRICIRSCCPKGFVFNGEKCERADYEVINFNVAIEHLAGIKIFNLIDNDEYALTYFRTCDGFLLDPHNEVNDKWLLVRHDNHVKLALHDTELNENEYCIMFDNNQTLHAIACIYDEEHPELSSARQIFLPIG